MSEKLDLDGDSQAILGYLSYIDAKISILSDASCILSRHMKDAHQYIDDINFDRVELKYEELSRKLDEIIDNCENLKAYLRACSRYIEDYSKIKW